MNIQGTYPEVFVALQKYYFVLVAEVCAGFIFWAKQLVIPRYACVNINSKLIMLGENTLGPTTAVSMYNSVVRSHIYRIIVFVYSSRKQVQ